MHHSLSNSKAKPQNGEKEIGSESKIAFEAEQKWKVGTKLNIKKWNLGNLPKHVDAEH